MDSIYGPWKETIGVVLDELKENLFAADDRHYVQTGEHLFEHVSSRIKSDQSMRDKCRRRNLAETPENALTVLRDAIGLRVVCTFIDDIYKIRRAFMGFGNCKIVEEKDYIRHPKPNGYRSYHLILAVDNPDHTEGTPAFFYAEIQLRTIAMDSWAALEHKLNYKRHIENHEMIVAELKRCADELAGCDLSMQTIRDLIREAK